MTKNSSPKTGAKPGASRDDRLKAALKANMARRKAQAREVLPSPPAPDSPKD